MEIRKVLALGVGFVGATQLAAAQATGLAVFMAQGYTQTGSSTTAFNGYYAAERVDLTNGGATNPTDATATRPNGTIDTLASSGSVLIFQTGYYSSLSAFNTDFGLGSYTFSGNSGSLSGVTANNNVMWAPVPPVVTNYSALQSLDPSAGLDVTFSPFSIDTNANFAATFISLFDVTTSSFVPNSGVQDLPGATDYIIGPGMLAQNQTYALTIDDANRFLYSPASDFQGATPYISYDVNTTITFTTTPEPAPIAMFAIGLVGLGVRRSRRGRGK